MQFDIFIKVVLQIINRTGFTRRLAQMGYDQVSQYIIIYGITPHKFKHLVQDELCAVEQDTTLFKNTL